MKLVPDPWEIDYRRAFRIFDHFTEYTDAKTWTATVTNSSVPGISSTAQDGVLAMINTGATNDAIYIATTNAYFKWANNVPVVAEALVQFSEASTNNINVFFGLSSTVTATLMANGNGAMTTSGTIAGLWKQGAALGWRAFSSQGTTQTNTATDFTAAAQTGYQRLRVQIEINNSVAEVTYWIDQGSGLRQCRDTGNPSRPIKDVISLSSPAAMKLVVAVKNGSANAETLNVDYMGGWALNSNFVASS